MPSDSCARGRACANIRPETWRTARAPTRGCRRSPLARRCVCSSDLSPPIVDHDSVALNNSRAEAYHARIFIIYAPKLGADCFAREYRRGKPPRYRGQPDRIIAANGLEQRVACDPESRKTMQNRARETGGLGEFRIGVQRVDVAGQPVNQRHFRPGSEIAYTIRRACRQRVRRRHLAFGPAEAAIGAAERGLLERREFAPARFVDDCPVSYTHLTLPTIYSV